MICFPNDARRCRQGFEPEPRNEIIAERAESLPERNVGYSPIYFKKYRWRRRELTGVFITA